MRLSLTACVVLGYLVAACNGDGEATTGAPSATGSVDGATQDASRLTALLRAELSRRPDQVLSDDLSSRSATIRRAAARALARSRSAAARDGLVRLLSDEDEEVVAWAAYGLGDHCTGDRQKIVSALVAAAAARLADSAPSDSAPSDSAPSDSAPSDRAPSAGGPSSAGAPSNAPSASAASAPPRVPSRYSARRAITRAIGRCASSQSEPTLVGWARQRDEHTLDAVHAIGDLATQHRKLREETVVALLELAAGNAAQKPIAEALYPLGRVKNLPPSVVERTLEVAEPGLAREGPARLYAVRALARCDDDAIVLLSGVVVDAAKYNAAERAEAARGLARFGRRGQKALQASLGTVAADDSTEATLTGRNVGVLLAIIGSMDAVGTARKRLGALAELEPAHDASKATLRRLSWVRCSAAKLLAERDFDMPALRACDLSIAEDAREKHPLVGSIGARAVVDAIGVDGVKIRGKRLVAWRAYATGGDLRARQAALELLTTHTEIRESAEVLAAALSAKESGLVGTAAQIIAKHPKRARKPGKTKKEDGPIHPDVVSALMKVLGADPAASDLEALASAIDAIGALAVANAKARVHELCRSPYAVLREHSRLALAKMLGGADRVQCETPGELPLPVELERLAEDTVNLTLDTEAGTLTMALDPSVAPIAVTRARDLVKSGFYDGMVVHRVVPGFVSQFGSPTADGFGGAPNLPALPCETSPLRYTPYSVGVALAGRDTGSSQFFVTHTATPHLDGKYALIGSATGAWDALVDGDVIKSVKIVAPKK